MFDFILKILFNLDSHLQSLFEQHQILVFVILFFIILLETGAVVLGFLPGDSLLFITGIVSQNVHSSIYIAFFVFWAAATVGNIMNFEIGRRFGKPLLNSPKLQRFIPPSTVIKAQVFYSKHGGKTVFLSRFLPFLRTLAPFVAGIAKMDRKLFILYSALTGGIWSFAFTFSGYSLGHITFIKDNLLLVSLLVILASSTIPLIASIIRKYLPSR